MLGMSQHGEASGVLKCALNVMLMIRLAHELCPLFRCADQNSASVEHEYVGPLRCALLTQT